MWFLKWHAECFAFSPKPVRRSYLCGSPRRVDHAAFSQVVSLRDAFAVLFFVSVGMWFNPSVMWQGPLQVLVVMATIIVGKSLAIFFGLIAACLRAALQTPYSSVSSKTSEGTAMTRAVLARSSIRRLAK